MSKQNGMMKRFAKLATLLILGASMSACAGLFGFGGTSWKEEALQPDGQKIVVDREVSRKGRHEIGQSPPIGNQSLAFTMPVTGERVKWEDTYSEELGSASFNPMLLVVLKGKAYVLSAPAGCLSYNKWGRPNPPYVIFKNEGKEWNRISIQELPTEIVNPNLIISSPDDEVEQSGKRFITAEMIGRMNQGFKQPEYQTILREPIRSAGQGCPVSTTMMGKPVAPVVDGEILYYNWWPLATDWLGRNYGSK
ncbi:MAG: hypothetical protein PXX77_10785 [Gallionella sp.]|nr:hypothetical protein [Gallionella sp.]